MNEIDYLFCFRRGAHPVILIPEFNTLWAEGKSMTMEQAIQLALS